MLRTDADRISPYLDRNATATASSAPSLRKSPFQYPSGRLPDPGTCGLLDDLVVGELYPSEGAGGTAGVALGASAARGADSAAPPRAPVMGRRPAAVSPSTRKQAPALVERRVPHARAPPPSRLPNARGPGGEPWHGDGRCACPDLPGPGEQRRAGGHSRHAVHDAGLDSPVLTAIGARYRPGRPARARKHRGARGRDSRRHGDRYGHRPHQERSDHHRARQRGKGTARVASPASVHVSPGAAEAVADGSGMSPREISTIFD